MTLALDLVKRDGTPVRAEFLRPREWVERNGIVSGAVLPIAISELEIEGDAFVMSITACPLVAEGPGRVVTGRFVTRDAGNLVQITLENGTEIRATDVHPVWSVVREEWIPAGELVPGELVDTLTGPVAVETVERLHSGLDVYNIEVHGEHVFRVTADGVLVHNACATTSSPITSIQLHHPWPKYLGGPSRQLLVPLPRDVHSAYHSGLDKLLPRQWGAQYYSELGFAARTQAYGDLAAYTKAFDGKHGTSLWNALIENGFPGVSP